MITRIENEIVQLHKFFQDWYNNDLAPTDENFSRCAGVLAPSFSIIFPSGDMVYQQPLLETLHKSHYSRVGMRIWIENVQVRHHIGELILATYEEWQEIEGQVTARLSSVLFQEAQSTPNGLQWLHVHETWIKI
jgi:hypothetical protein